MADGDEREEQPESYDDLDQEWTELVEEHRLAMPGSEVLFGFLLVLPFTDRFAQLTTEQTYVYFAALLCAAVAIVLLITPTANHRILWRRRRKNALLLLATRTSLAATVFMALAMTASVFLIADYLFGSPVTSSVTAILAALFAWFWYAMPLVTRLRTRAEPEEARARERAVGGSRAR